MRVAATRLRPSGAHHLDTAEGGRHFDSSVHKEPHPARRPATFQPTYGIQGPPFRPWYDRVPVFRWCVALGAAAICIYGICGLVRGALDQFNP